MLSLSGEPVMSAKVVNELQEQAWHAFQRDLPQLYAERPGQWVAYQGDQTRGFSREKHLLYRQCLDQGLQRDEFVVFCVEPLETEISFAS
jgi:hypothetical protein